MQPIEFTENVKDFLKKLTAEERNQIDGKLAFTAQKYCDERVTIFGHELRNLTVELDSLFIQMNDRYIKIHVTMNFTPVLPIVKNTTNLFIVIKVREIFEFPDEQSFLKDIELLQKQNEKHGK